MSGKVTNRWGIVARELVMAGFVLSLVFLSFAHKPLDQVEVSRVFLLADGSVPVFCGSAPANEGGSSAHNTCDACRVASGVALSGEACAPTQIFAPVLRVGLRAQSGFRPSGILDDAIRPRAPPVNV